MEGDDIFCCLETWLKKRAVKVGGNVQGIAGFRIFLTFFSVGETVGDAFIGILGWMVIYGADNDIGKCRRQQTTLKLQNFTTILTLSEQRSGANSNEE